MSSLKNSLIFFKSLYLFVVVYFRCTSFFNFFYNKAKNNSLILRRVFHYLLVANFNVQWANLLRTASIVKKERDKKFTKIYSNISGRLLEKYTHHIQ